MKKFGIKPKSILRQRRARRRKVIALFFGVLATCLLAGIVYGLHRDEVRIGTVHIHGLDRIDEDDVRVAVQSVVRGRYFFLIPRDSFFFYPKKSIESALLGSFSRVENVHLKKQLFNSVEIRLREYEPYALWCMHEERQQEESTPTTTIEHSTNDAEAGSCFYIDKDGYAFSTAPTFTSSSYFLYVDKRGSGDAVRSHLFEEDYFQSFDTFIQHIKDLGFSPAFATVDVGSTISIKLEDNGYILVDRDMSLETMYANLVSVVRDPGIAFSPDDSLFEYIDIRYDGKVFLRFIE